MTAVFILVGISYPAHWLKGPNWTDGANYVFKERQAAGFRLDPALLLYHE